MKTVFEFWWTSEREITARLDFSWPQMAYDQVSYHVHPYAIVCQCHFQFKAPVSKEDWRTFNYIGDQSNRTKPGSLMTFWGASKCSNGIQPLGRAAFRHSSFAGWTRKGLGYFLSANLMNKLILTLQTFLVTLTALNIMHQVRFPARCTQAPISLRTIK
jgi:hypothetical protein